MKLVTELSEGFLLVHIATKLIYIPQLDIGLEFMVEHIGHIVTI